MRERRQGNTGRNKGKYKHRKEQSKRGDKGRQENTGKE
jgi:hypothetical protein